MGRELKKKQLEAAGFYALDAFFVGDDGRFAEGLEGAGETEAVGGT